MTTKPFNHLSRFSRRRFLQGTSAAAIAFSLRPFRANAAGQVNVYNWDTYIGETTLDDFSDATGISVQYDLFADNEELFAKLKAGNPGYDVIFPSDYMIESMLSLDMLVPLDFNQIPNVKHVHPNFMDAAFDPGRKHSLAYMWGTMGNGYRKSKVSGAPDTWGIYLDPDMASAHSGKLALLGDQRATLGIALKYLGHSLNSTSASEINAAADLLIAAKKHIKTFAEDNGQDLLLSREVDITMEWNGDIVQVMTEDDDLSYVVPKEGSVVWQDGMAIPKGAPNMENAHAFINYILDPEVNAKITDFIKYATANKDAMPMLPKEDLANPAIYPPESVVANCEAIVDVGDAATIYDEAWTRVQAA
ncbi:MAG: spermidine/putrescine ABC transporter substrate-binding protein [Rhodospirillales bacterium]